MTYERVACFLIGSPMGVDFLQSVRCVGPKGLNQKKSFQADGEAAQERSVRPGGRHKQKEGQEGGQRLLGASKGIFSKRGGRRNDQNGGPGSTAKGGGAKSFLTSNGTGAKIIRENRKGE